MADWFGVAPHKGKTTKSGESLQTMIEVALQRRVVAWRRLTSGTVNQTFRLTLDDGADVIYRQGPTDDGVRTGPSWMTSRGLAREQAAMSLLHPLSDLLPKTLAHDFSRSNVAYDWVVQSVVPGISMTQVIPTLSRGNRIDLHRHVGELLRSVHRVRGTSFGPPSDGKTYATWTDLVLADCHGFLEDAERWNLPDGQFVELIEFAESSRTELDQVQPVLIHSDLTLQHLFVVPDRSGWRISGMIDLEFARFADPLSEGFLLEMRERTDEAASAFLNAYGPIDRISEIRVEIARRLLEAWLVTDLARLAHVPDGVS